MRYVKYHYEYTVPRPGKLGPYFVDLPTELAIKFYGHMKEKATACELMPEGFIPTKEDLRGDT